LRGVHHRVGPVGEPVSLRLGSAGLSNELLPGLTSDLVIALEQAVYAGVHKSVPTRTIIAFSTDMLQRLDLAHCTRLDDAGITFILQQCPHLRDVDISGCRQIERMLVPLARSFKRFSCSGTSLPLATIRSLAEKSQRVEFLNTPGERTTASHPRRTAFETDSWCVAPCLAAMYEWLNDAANLDFQETVMRLSITSLAEQLQEAVTQVHRLLTSKARGGDVVAKALVGLARLLSRRQLVVAIPALQGFAAP
jgi:hypothetical protein